MFVPKYRQFSRLFSPIRRYRRKISAKISAREIYAIGNVCQKLLWIHFIFNFKNLRGFNVIETFRQLIRSDVAQFWRKWSHFDETFFDILGIKRAVRKKRGEKTQARAIPKSTAADWRRGIPKQWKSRWKRKTWKSNCNLDIISLNHVSW